MKIPKTIPSISVRTQLNRSGPGLAVILFIYLDQIKNLKLVDIQHVIKKYYLPSNRSVGVFIHDKTNAFCIGRINLPLKESNAGCVEIDIANQMVGGGTFLSSRISNRLRETEGLSYGAGSFDKN